MPPIPVNSIKITSQTSSPGENRRRVLTSHGRVKSVAESFDGRHAEIHVSHAAPKKAKETTKGAPTFGPDSGPESRVVISKHHAKHFPVGGRVKIRMTPLADDDDTGTDVGDEG